MTVIRASELGRVDYCEYSFILGSKLSSRFAFPKTSKLEEGIQAHKRIDELFLKQTKRQVSLKDFLWSQRRIRTRLDPCNVILSAKIDYIKLTGRFDELVSDITGIYVIDDKLGNRAFEGQKNQVRAYCLLLEENFKEILGHKSIYGMLRNSRSGLVFWREKFSEDIKRNLLNVLQRTADLKEGKVQPVKTSNSAKCSACKYLEACKEKQQI